MARKNYPEEFKRDAVALFRDTEGATIVQIAGDLGVHEATLTAWCRDAGVPIRRGRSTAAAAGAVGSPETPAEEVARLRAEVKALRAEQAKLNTEREILRKAAKYFAGETNW